MNITNEEWPVMLWHQEMNNLYKRICGLGQHHKSLQLIELIYKDPIRIKINHIHFIQWMGVRIIRKKDVNHMNGNRHSKLGSNQNTFNQDQQVYKKLILNQLKWKVSQRGCICVMLMIA